MLWELLFTLGLLAITYATGRMVEIRHDRSLLKREELLATSPVPFISVDTDAETLERYPLAEIKLLTASVVMGSDYFRHTLAGFVNFIGGRVTVMERLLDRARREATLRLREQGLDAAFICNVRYETAFLDDPGVSASIPKVEVMVYATAFYLK
jgi:uncharacterized protein YbjQ (UPF0145 family)